MNILPDNMLVLVVCVAILAVCILVFVVVFKIARLIKSLKAKYAAMGLSALYILSPIDLIPDLIPGLGQIDDAGALAALIGMAASIYSEHKKRKIKT
jgi:uncharacterized membrane protein YkvA (DUF1232 family)